MAEFTPGTLSEELAHASIASRINQALSHPTAHRCATRRRSRRRRAGAADHYIHYLIARAGASR